MRRSLEVGEAAFTPQTFTVRCAATGSAARKSHMPYWRNLAPGVVQALFLASRDGLD